MAATGTIGELTHTRRARPANLSLPDLRMRLLLPDLAMVAAVATMVCLFAGSGSMTALFRDSDTGWHIRNGEWMLAHGSLPVTDIFSFSRYGAPWVSWEWGADILMGAANRLAGLDGIACLFGSAIGAAVWLWFRLNRAAKGNFILAAVFAAPAIAVTSIHWLARPHVFGWLFMLVTLWWCECEPSKLRLSSACMIVLISAAWANLHGSFFLGTAILLSYAAGAGIANAIWDLRRPATPYLWGAVAAAFGSLLNPLGWHLHQHVLQYLNDTRLLSHVGEFQSFDFHSSGAGWAISTLFIGIVGGVAALNIRRPERFLLALAFTTGALISARYLPLAALALLPLANSSISEILSLARGLRPLLRRYLDRGLVYSETLGHFDQQLCGFALVPLIIVLLFAGIRGKAAFPPATLPVAAAEQIASLPVNARIFSTDSFGGYLIYRFSGERRIFFDGRSDFYGADFAEAYMKILQSRPGWREIFDRWNFTHALLPPDTPSVAALEARGWREIYRDHTVVLLANREK